MFDHECPEPYEDDMEIFGCREVDEDAAAGEFEELTFDPEAVDEYPW